MCMSVNGTPRYCCSVMFWYVSTVIVGHTQISVELIKFTVTSKY